MDLSIIIVNYNTHEYLRNCLDSLLTHTENLEFEVFVVDNNSPDRYIEKFPGLYPGVKFLFKLVNDGFGAGCNYGLRYSAGKYILFLNPDVIINNNAIHTLYKFIESNPDIAVISPIYGGACEDIKFTSGSFPGYLWEVTEALGNIFMKLYCKWFEEDKSDIKFPFEVNWVMGSFMMCNKSVLNNLKGFDENFFLYYEDIDLQLRIKKLGFKIYYHPGAQIEHVKRSSVRTFDGENTYYYHMTRSNLIYMYKHFGFFKRNIIRSLHLFGIIIRILSLPLRKVYREKKKQKLNQYIIKWKQFVAKRDTIFANTILSMVKTENGKTQVISNDKFWQIKTN